MAMSQDSAFVAAEDRQADALKFLHGWKGGIYEAVQSTSPDSISRSKLTDRSAMPMYSWPYGFVCLVWSHLHTLHYKEALLLLSDCIYGAAEGHSCFAEKSFSCHALLCSEHAVCNC